MAESEEDYAMSFRLPSVRSSYQFVLALGLFVFIVGDPLVSYTQSSGCPTTGGANGNPGWAPNSTIRYSFNSNMTADQQQQVINGLIAWNTANQTNGSGVQFLAASANHPANYTFQNGDLGAAADPVGISFQTTNGVLTSATVTFNTGARIGGTANGALTIQPGQPGYTTIYQKMSEHEMVTLWV
jgi:hypothetical protein